MNDTKLKKLEDLLALVDTDHITNQQFNDAIDELIAIVAATKKYTEEQIEEVRTLAKEEIEDLRAFDVKRWKSIFDRASKLKDGDKGDQGPVGEKGDKGEPGQDGAPGAPGAPGKDGSPDMAEDIRNKLELLDGDERLKIEAIKDLREELDKIKKQTTKFGGGTMGLSVGHWARHEAFTMDGIATSVSLTEGGVGAAGTACIVRYQGQTLDMTSQYTVNGNKITLVGFTPEAGTIISVTYWP